MSGGSQWFVRWPRVRHRWREVKSRVLVALVRGALFVLSRLSLPRAVALGEQLGIMAYYLLRHTRRLALRHLELAYGSELPARAREHIGRAAFANFGRAFCELAQVDTIRQRREQLFELEGREHLEYVLASGRGCIAVTGHIGNWELLAAYFAWQGIPVSAVARRVYVPRLNALIVDWRRRQGVDTIVRESPEAARTILRVLKNNGILALVIDQDTYVPSISVPFFGRSARTPVAAAALAARRQLPAVPVFIQRRGELGWRVRVCPPLYADAKLPLPQRVRLLTQKLNEALEQQIRANPTEWVWWHRRWRRAPIAKLDLDARFQYGAVGAVESG